MRARADNGAVGKEAEMTKLLSVQNLSVKVPSADGKRGLMRRILDDVCFSLEAGEHLCIVGPNGAGKSTIVNSIAQGISYSGTITYMDQDLRSMKSAALARILGVLFQSHEISYSFTVEEVVRMGRYAYAPTLFSPKPADDEEKIREALELTGLTPLAGQSVLTLSGGELQRVFLAQLFAQDPQILVLDEPANHLDLQYQKQLFSLLEKWQLRSSASKARGIISVVHDLSLAKAFGDRALLLHEGKVRGFGRPNEVLSHENLESVYGMDVYAWFRQLLSGWQ